MRPGNSSLSKSIKGKKFVRTGERQRSATEAPDLNQFPRLQSRSSRGAGAFPTGG